MQPTHAGWYWDPMGRPGLFRWWDGTVWTRHVTPDRTDPSPEPFAPTPADADGRLTTAGLTFPELPPPWRQCPAYPGFGHGIGQERGVGRTPRGEYDALVVIGAAPDRFAELSPTDVADALCAEVLRTFYPHESPAASPAIRSTDVDGAPAVRLDVPLDVTDPTLDFEREELLLVVVPTADGHGLLYASLPEVEGVLRPDDVVRQLRLAE